MLQTHLAATMTSSTDLGLIPFSDVTLLSDPAETRRFQESIEQQLASRKISEQDIFRSTSRSKKRLSTPSSTATRWIAPKRFASRTASSTRTALKFASPTKAADRPR